MVVMASDGLSLRCDPISLPCALAFPPPSHCHDWDATTRSPSWAPHFVTNNASYSRIPSRASSASPPPRRWATTCCRLSLCSCTAPVCCSLQPLLKLSLFSLGPSLLQFVSIVSLLPNHGNLVFKSVCVFTFSFSVFAFLIEMDFSSKSLFAIWSLSLQRFHYFFYLCIVAWQYQTYSTILILVLRLSIVCVTLLVCSSYWSFTPSSPFFRSWLGWHKDGGLFTYTLVLQCSPSTSSSQPQTTHVTVFADSRIALLCHALHICVAHAPPESCPSFLSVHLALCFRACYRNRLPLLHHAFLPQNYSVQTFIRGQPPGFERLDDAFVLLIGLIFLYPQKILISVRWQFEL